MGKPVSIPYFLSAAGGAEGTVAIYTVPGGKTLTITKAGIAFPVGTYFELELALRYGDMQVLPEGATLKGDNMMWEKNCELKWFSGDDVILYYKNLNATEIREANLNLDGELA